MVFAHVCDALVAPEAWRGPFGQLYGSVRGLTAPLFFLVSGMAFAVVSLPRHAEHHRWSPVLEARLRRVGALVLWGSALTLPWWAEGFPFKADPAVWYPFLSFGVLHCIAAGLLGGLLLLRLTRTPAQLGVWSTAAALIALFSGPPVQHWASQQSPLWRGAFFAGSFGGGFPLFPWVGFFFFGVALGAVAHARPGATGRFFAVSGVAAALSLAASVWLRPAFHSAGAADPSMFLRRLGVALGILAALALAARFVRLPFSKLASRHALTFYVAHMLIIWGVPFVPGLQFRIGPTLGFAASAAISAACLLLIGGSLTLALQLGEARQRRPAGAIARRG